MKWYKVEEVLWSDKPFLKKVKVGGKKLCLVGYEGVLYALSAKCPHAGADLSGGWCTDGKIVCPYHRHSFSLQTGKGSPGQNDYVNTYPVKVEGTEIFVGIKSFWELFQ